MPRTPIPWSRLLAEAAAIVGSILLALAGDAWWSDRQLQREVGEELRSIYGELEFNEEAIAFQMDMMRRIQDASASIERDIRALPQVESIAVTDTLAWLVLSPTPTLDASLGGIDALIASGRLPAIELAELRLRLAGLRDQIDDAVEEQILARSVQEGRLRPIVEAHSDLDLVRQLGQDFWSNERVPGRGLESSGVVRFPTDLPALNALSRRREVFTIAIEEMRALLTSFAQIRSLINRELGTEVEPTGVGAL